LNLLTDQELQFVTPPKKADEKLAELVKQTVERGGKVLMPVLGTGRAQEVLVVVDKLLREKKMADVPVYIDGVVWDIAAIHTAYPEYLTSSIRRKFMNDETNPFLNPNFKRVGSGKERKEVIASGEPCVIIATSGMMNGGASVEYFKGLAENEKNLLVLSCYQGPGTMGRRIQRGEKEIGFAAGQRQHITHVKMEISKIDISGHADRNGLMDFISQCEPKPRKVLINHGEASSCLDFASSIHKQWRMETIAPKNLDSIRLK